MGEQEIDPYDPEPPFTYECVNCGHRVKANAQPQRCPDCGDTMTDLSVPRE